MADQSTTPEPSPAAIVLGAAVWTAAGYGVYKLVTRKPSTSGRRRSAGASRRKPGRDAARAVRRRARRR